MKTIGILNTCTPDEEELLKTSEFENMQNLLDHAEHDYALREFRVTEGEFPDAAECDAYLITGSPASVYEDKPWIHQLAGFVQREYKAETPLVGICFGHQMLAHALGGRTEKATQGWGLGLREIEYYDPPQWLADHLENDAGTFYFCHQDQVTQLPAEAKLVAGNAFCPNGMFLMKDHVFAIQAHPEFTADIMRKAVDFLEPHLDPTAVTDARQTETLTSEGSKVADWIVTFLEQAEKGKS